MNFTTVHSEQKNIRTEIKFTLVLLPIATFLFGVFISFLYMFISPYIKSPLLLAFIFIVPSSFAFLGVKSAFNKLFKQINNL